MHILITGGSGFLGASLARELLKKPLIRIEGRSPAPLSTLFLTDLHKIPDDLAAESRVIPFIGDLNELITSKTLPLNKIDAVIHLSAAVSAECEANLDLGLQSNLLVSLNSSSITTPCFCISKFCCSLWGISWSFFAKQNLRYRSAHTAK
jgi:nucleoside-diphosphate-sugar epimerase